MARRKEDPRKKAMRKLMGDFLRENDISLKDGCKFRKNGLSVPHKRNG